MREYTMADLCPGCGAPWDHCWCDMPDEYEDDSCTHCAGDGYDECRDPIQCTRPHTTDGLCPCGACGGTGRAKDQTIW